MKSALIITSEYIGSANEIGSHHIAKQLAKLGIKTYVISFPISPLYRFYSHKTDYQKRNQFSKGFTQVFENLYSYVPKVLIPPAPIVLKYVPFYLNIWEHLVHKRSSLNLDRFDLVFCESVFYPNLLKKVSYKKLVVRIPDNFSGFWPGNNTLKKAENDLITRADLVVTPSHLNKKNLKEFYPKKNIQYLANGVEYNIFQEQHAKPSIFKAYKYNAIYVGAIAKWFDFNLLFNAAKQNPLWQFVIIGKPPEIASPENVKFIGEKRHQDKVAYLQYANVGIIPFDTRKNKDLIDYVNPLKMYEYLASGIPVISTNWAEINLIKAPITTIDSCAEFNIELKKLESDTVEKEQLKNFAKVYDWQEITKKLIRMAANA